MFFMHKNFLITFLALFFFNVSYAQKTILQADDDHYFRTGLELLDKQKFGAARQAFEKYQQENPDNIKSAEAEYYIAYSSLALYNEDGEYLVEDFIEDNEHHPKAMLAYFELGNFYFKDKNYPKSIEYLKKVDLSQLSNTQKAETQFKIGYAYFSRKSFDKALEYFDQIKRFDNEFMYAANYYAGFIEFRNGAYDNAIVDLQRAEKSDAYASIVPYMIANVYYKQKRFDDLISYTENLLEHRDDLKNEEEIYLLTAEAYYRKGNYEKAAAYFEEYANESGRQPESGILYRLAYAQYATNQNEKAIENFKLVATTEDTVSQLASYYLGALYLKESNNIFAVAAFDKARKSNFNEEIQELAAFNYAKVNYELGNYTDAIQAFQEFSKKYPQSAQMEEANELLSSAYLNSNDYNQAIRHIESLPSKSDKVKQVYQKVTFLKGTEYFNNARYFNSVQMFEKSLQLPFDPKYVILANFWSGEAYSIGRKWEEAIDSYSSVFQVPGSESSIIHLKSRYGIGYAYYNTGEYEKALLHFRVYVDKVENASNKMFYNDALLRLADTYYAGKNYSSALNYYDQAISQKNPDLDYAYFQKGAISSLQTNASAAKSNFDIVINQFPRSPYVDDAIFEKAQVDFEQGNYEVAISGFSNLIQEKSKSPFVPYALQRRAIAYTNLQNYEAASSDYQTVVTEFPTHTVANGALLGLQESLSAQGKADQFAPFLATYKKANPGNEALESIEFESAKNLYFSQKYDQAISSFNDYMQSYPQSPFADEAKYYIGESYYRLNDIDKALQYYYDVVEENNTNHVNRSIQRIAELEFQNENYQQSIEFAYRLATIAKNKKEQYNAWAGLMESYFHLNKYDSVERYARLILEKGNVNANAQTTAQLFLGKSAYARGNDDEAVDQFLNTLNTAKDENGAEAQYLMAEIFYKKQQYQQSIETLYDLNTNFSLYENWLGKSFLLIADNYLALDEKFQAEATLNSLIEKSPDPEIVESAKNKLLLIQEKEVEADQEINQVDTSTYEIIGN